MPAVWAGIDPGKRAHHCVVIDQSGEMLLAQRIDNDETVLLEIIATVTEIADGHEVVWATDLNSGGAALLISLLVAHGQQLLYIPGRIIHHAAATYRGEGKTDAKDARIIADQARMRTDLQPVHDGDQISVDLKLLTAWTSSTTGCAQSIGSARPCWSTSPRWSARSTTPKAKPLLSTYRTPGAFRRMGVTRLAAWLKARGCRNSVTVAQKAIDAAREQETTLSTEIVAATLGSRLAAVIAAIDAELVELDATITARFNEHENAEILQSMPGFGPIFAATFLANMGGDLRNFENADRLASVAGVAPAPRDSGRISGNHHRPRRFNRRLLRTCYLAALSSLKNSPASRIYYDRKRAEGKSHKQALLALSRRRINVIWAMLRDHTPYQEPAIHRPLAA